MADRTVSDLMTRTVVTVPPDTSFKSVARLLLERSVDAVPVVDDGQVLGVVSAADLTCHAEEPPGLPALLLGGRERRSHARKRRGRTAQELMTAPPACVPPGATVCEALEVMQKAGVGRVLVVEDGRLVGILTRTDVLRDYVRDDDDLRRDVERAVRRAVGTCPARPDVEVRDGVVLLRGWVERTSCAWAMAAAAREVPGVVDVDDDVLSDVDDTVINEMAARGPWI